MGETNRSIDVKSNPGSSPRSLWKLAPLDRPPGTFDEASKWIQPPFSKQPMQQGVGNNQKGRGKGKPNTKGGKPTPQPGSLGPCNLWARTGKCFRGDACWYKHE